MWLIELECQSESLSVAVVAPLATRVLRRCMYSSCVVRAFIYPYAAETGTGAGISTAVLLIRVLVVVLVLSPVLVLEYCTIITTSTTQRRSLSVRVPPPAAVPVL